MFMEILVLAVMLIIFIGGGYIKIPVPFTLLIASLAGALVSGFGIPIYHFVEGSQDFLFLMLIVITGIVFMAMIEASGALDTLTRFVVEKFHRFPALVLSCLMIIIMLPGMLTGSAPAAILSTGVMVTPILKKMGIPKLELACILAIGGCLGIAAPPINVPAMIIATGVYMPYEGFTGILLFLTIPTAVFSVLYLGLKHTGEIDPKKALEDIPPYPPQKYLTFLPLLLVLGLMAFFRVFPEVSPDIGTPLIFMLGAFLAVFTGRKFNFLRVSKQAMHKSVKIIAIFTSVGILIQIMSLTGVRGLFVIMSLTLGGILYFVALSVFVPILGGPIMPFGVAGVLGIPIVLGFAGYNTVIVTAGLTLMMSMGALFPPSSIAGYFALEVAEYEEFGKFLKRCTVPTLVIILAGILTIGFVDQVEYLFTLF